jgi:outer membrane biosynthesis protein TonB
MKPLHRALSWFAMAALLGAALLLPAAAYAGGRAGVAAAPNSDTAIATPSPAPSDEATESPSDVPTESPTDNPTPTPTDDPPPTPTPEVTPTPTPTSTPEFEETPTPTPSGPIVDETGTPRITPPSTDAGVTGSPNGSGGLPIVLVALAGILLTSLALTPRRKAKR